MNCKKCGSVLGPTDQVCKVCGQSVNQVEPVEEVLGENVNIVTPSVTQEVAPVQVTPVATQAAPVSEPVPVTPAPAPVDIQPQVVPSVAPVAETVQVTPTVAPVVPQTPDVSPVAPAPAAPATPIVEIAPLNATVAPVVPATPEPVVTPVATEPAVTPVVSEPVVQAVTPTPVSETPAVAEIPVVAPVTSEPVATEPAVTPVVSEPVVQAVTPTPVSETPAVAEIPVVAPVDTPAVNSAPVAEVSVDVPVQTVTETPANVVGTVPNVPSFNGQNPELATETSTEPQIEAPNMPPISAPVSNEQVKPVQKSHAGLIFAIVGVLVVLGGGAYFMLPKLLNSNTNKPLETTKALDYSIKLNDYVFKTTKNYKYQYSGDALEIQSDDENTITELKLVNVKLSSIIEENIKETFTSKGYQVNNFKKATQNDKNIITFEIESSTIKIVVAYVEVTSETTAVVTIGNNTKYDYDMLTEVIEFISTGELDDVSNSISLNSSIEEFRGGLIDEITNSNVENTETNTDSSNTETEDNNTKVESNENSKEDNKQ